MATFGGKFSWFVLRETNRRLSTDCAQLLFTTVGYSRHDRGRRFAATNVGKYFLFSSSSHFYIFRRSCVCNFRHFCSSASDEKAPSTSTATTRSETPAPASTSTKTKKPADRILRVTPAPKHSGTAIPAQFSYSKADLNSNKLLGAAKAKSEYCLTDEQLNGLTPLSRRSPYYGAAPCKMYRQGEVLAKALAVHGNVEALEAARARSKTLEFVSDLDAAASLASSGGDHRSHSLLWLLHPSFSSSARKEGQKPSNEAANKKAAMRSGTERVVLTAVAVNAGALVVKLIAWLYTGSHSLMAESLHSLADTINQGLVAYGIYQSGRKPDKMHPYGYSNVRYVTSLVSGIGIFYIGSAMSLYHGLRGLWLVTELESVPVGLLVLGISFLGDGVTFLMARKLVTQKAAAAGVTRKQYVRSGEDPSISVVYLEDQAALYGVGIASICLSLSMYMGTSIPDAIGSMLIGLVLFQVAFRIIAMNVDQLLGRSIPLREIDQISRALEADPIIRSSQDIKATELGSGEIRFKAEVDFDGGNLTRTYLKTVDIQKLLEEVQSIKTPAELELFMIKQGENITDCLGAEIDRIEQELKKKFPDIRHVDLEAL